MFVTKIMLVSNSLYAMNIIKLARYIPSSKDNITLFSLAQLAISS